MDFTQFADNGKTVGSLNGAASVEHDTTYRSWMPSLDARYKLKSNWTVYAQFATGSVIPPSQRVRHEKRARSPSCRSPPRPRPTSSARC